jgi:SAM-dependent methyltransferase
MLPGEQACYVGVDLSPEMLSSARQKTVCDPPVYVIQADVTQPLAFPKEEGAAVSPVRFSLDNMCLDIG